MTIGPNPCIPPMSWMPFTTSECKSGLFTIVRRSQYEEMATLDSGAHPIKRAAANPALEILERLGYVARGVLYAVMGVLALRIAMAQPGGQATDLTGSLGGVCRAGGRCSASGVVGGWLAGVLEGRCKRVGGEGELAKICGRAGPRGVVCARFFFSRLRVVHRAGGQIKSAPA